MMIYNLDFFILKVYLSLNKKEQFKVNAIS